MATPALPGLPAASSRRLAARVTRDAERQIRGGHPWVFDTSITSISPHGATGDLAVVFDGKRRFVAVGLYDASSPIRIRILQRGAPAPIDSAWWHDRIGAAFERRRDLADSSTTTGYRCVHGENDGLPGLVVDRYADTYVVKLYSSAWLAHLPAVVAAIEEIAGPHCVVLRLSRAVRDDRTWSALEGTALVGERPTGPVLFRENGLTFEADVLRGQKTGHFLDQRENRAAVGAMAGGARVLDVFACTGGFAVHAAAGGATSVLSVDQSPTALATARRNIEHNRALATVRACRFDTEIGDAFDVMATLARRGRRFDIVVVDPPSFAPRQANIDAARHAYGRLTTLAVPLVEPGGVLVQASCSSRVSSDDFYATVSQAASRQGVRLREIRRTGHPSDHPVGFPQGAYLKALFARVEPAGPSAGRR